MIVGLYFKKILMERTDIKEYSILTSKIKNYAFWTDEYKNNITNIIFKNSINYDEINNAIKSWNVSLMQSFYNNVIAYIYNDPEEGGKYILYIAGNGQVYTPYLCNNLFMDFQSLKKIDVTYLNTKYSRSMGSMFGYNGNLQEIIGLNNFQTEYCRNMENMFKYCSKLTELDLSNFNISNLKNMTRMFSNLSNIATIDLRNADFSDVTLYVDMFSNIGDGVTIFVKDSVAQTFIQNRLAEANKTATVQIK